MAKRPLFGTGMPFSGMILRNVNLRNLSGRKTFCGYSCLVIKLPIKVICYTLYRVFIVNMDDKLVTT